MLGRQEKREAQRRAILETTIALVRERGFEETRVQDVIARVGISEKTFFNYFATKQAVLEAHALETNVLYQAQLQNELADSARPVLTRLEEVVRLQAWFFSADRDLMTILVRRSGIFFGAQGEMRELQKSNQRLLADLLAQGQESGELDPELDPLLLAELFTAMLLLTTINWLDGWWDEQHDLERRLLAALRVFVDGCRVPTGVGKKRTGPRSPARRHGHEP